ncbi:MAG: C40 family peptidase [Deltaproteobacteria bacterium]|nr:C40 family peptidase [Deltaproteobacteria bacterium]
MDATYRRLLGAALGVVLLLAGCAGAPPPPPLSEPVAPLPSVSRSPREMALERALGEFSGVPYRSGGTAPDGVDCSGLIQALYQRTGVRLPRTVADQYEAGTPVRREDLRFGDVVFFNRYCQIRGRGPYLASIFSSVDEAEVCHNGIYLGGGRFMHASPRGVFITRLDAEVWRVSYRGARRYLPGDN